MSRMLTAAGALIAALAVATLCVTAAAPGAGRPRYLDRHASVEKPGQRSAPPDDPGGEGRADGPDRDRQAPRHDLAGQRRLQQRRREQRPAADDLPAADADRLQDRLDPVGRHRQPGRQHRAGLGRAVQHDPALRDRPLAAAHPGDLRGRRGARLRPPVPRDALPAVDRDGCDLGHRARAGRRRRDAPAAARHRRELELRAGAGPRARQPLGSLLRVRGPRSRSSRPRSVPRTSAGSKAEASTRRRSRPR
jgi:hypothetical protein